MDDMDINVVFEAGLSLKIGNASGLEVEGTPSVRQPVVPDVVCKPLHKAWGSLKHSPWYYLRKASCNSKPKAYYA
jgi:hypothetical protein